MPSIKDYNNKLLSLRNTKKVTTTMKMVSASKLRRAQEAQRRSLLYSQQLDAMLARLAVSVESVSHPLLEHRDGERRIAILLLSSDRGLCAGFNNNLIKFTRQWIQERQSNDKQLSLLCCGRRGYQYFHRREQAKKHYDDVVADPNFSAASRIGKELGTAFIERRYDSVYMAYNLFRSALSQQPVIRKILPIEGKKVAGKPTRSLSEDYLFEPKEADLLRMLLPKITVLSDLFRPLGKSGRRTWCKNDRHGQCQQKLR